MKRYSESEQEVIKAFFKKCAAVTRKSKKISDGVKRKQLEKWQNYDKKSVIDGLKIYNRMNIESDKTENYALGIIKNKDKVLKENESNKRNIKESAEGERLAEIIGQYSRGDDGENIKCDF